MAKIKAPNKEYNGLSAGVMFVQGVGETTDSHLIDWFRSTGYTVEEEIEDDNEKVNDDNEKVNDDKTDAKKTKKA